MFGKTYDPTTRRTRNFVLLVIFAVALPSLLLTGFGMIAIDNERVASLKRTHSVYKAIFKRTAEGFNARMDELVEESDTPLNALEAWATGESEELGDDFYHFFNTIPFGTNYFAISPCYDLKLREEFSRNGDGLPDALCQAINAELAENDAPSACSTYRSLLTEIDDSNPISCLVRKALARCLKKTGSQSEADQQLRNFSNSCRDLTEPTSTIARLIKRVEALTAADANQLPRIMNEAIELAEELSDPTLNLPIEQIEFLAGEAAASLVKMHNDPDARQARERLQLISTRQSLFNASANLEGEVGNKPVIRAIRVNGERRVVLAKAREALVGLELVPSGLDPFLNELLKEYEVENELQVNLLPVEASKCCDDDELFITSSFLRKTELAWRLDMYFANAEVFERLAKGRGRLYLWALILLVATLVIGIGKTVMVMLKETRLSKLKTDFVSSVSHELRTPLTSIRMFTETLLMGRVNNKKEERECLETIGKETERLSRLTEQILDFSRMEANRKPYTFRPECIHELIDQAVFACKPICRNNGFVIETDFSEDLPEVPMDRDAIVEVLINLLSNAFKYSQENRRVTIKARHDGNRLELSVTDQGIGIPKSEHKRIFEKFYRVDNKLCCEVSGSGLGLSLVKYIVQAHNGDISLDSIPGKGSTFTMHLPSVQKSSPPITASNRPEEG
ncbi:MAG: HAMP domain-containing histidine kinase [Proteobacteria bacterium]|nr:HAMP domain-containing histidine kinase [Pseudomonadota bacterium]